MNSEEIARLANVSRSTVSRVINNYPNVTEETRIKVQKVIDTHGYFPNNSARILTGKTNDIIGVFIAELDSDTSFNCVNSRKYQSLLTEIINKSKREGLLVLVNIVKDAHEFKDIEALFVNRMIYGGIFLGFPYKHQNLDTLAKKKYNIVFVDQYLRNDDPDQEFKKVDCRDSLGGFKATNYLIKKGHQDILCLTNDDKLSAKQRNSGYVEAMTSASLKRCLVKDIFDDESAYNQTLKAFEKDKPSALFIADDSIIVGVCKALDELGLKVGTDVSIVSYGGEYQYEAIKRSITTVDVDFSEIANQCMDLMDVDCTESYKRLTPKIVERSSVRKIVNK